MDGTELTPYRTSCVSGLASLYLSREEKARALAEKMRNEGEYNGVCFESSERLEGAVGAADIVSCATNSETPLVMGAALKGGAHLDLVVLFKHSMRECDDEVIKRGQVFIDNDAAAVEAGELVGAFERGVMRKEEIVGNLVKLINGDRVGRRDSKENTMIAFGGDLNTIKF